MSTSATLRANPRMIGARARRQMAEFAAAIRSRVESEGATGQMARLARAEGKIHAGELPEAGALLQEIKAALDERKEAAAVDAGLAESQRLAEARGEDTARVEPSPTREGGPTRDGFLWLVAKGRLAPQQRIAGERYRQLHDRANGGAVPSCLGSEGMSGHGQSTADPITGADAAGRALEAAHGHIADALGRVAASRIIGVVQSVCGRGVPCRQLAADATTRAADVVERELTMGLDMLARHWRLT